MSKTLLKNVSIITVDKSNSVIENGYILIESGIIKAVGTMQECELTNTSTVESVHDFHGQKAIMPGLIDTHTHSSLFRGVAENMKMWEWLPHYDLEHRSINDKDAYYAAKLCYLEALRNGTTTILDMYRNMHMCAEAAGEIGIKAHLAPYTANVAPYDFFDTFEQNVKLYDQFHGRYDGKIDVWMGLENIFYCDQKMYQDSVKFCLDNKIRLHTHACEQQEEEEAVIKHFNKTSIEVLDSYGVLGDNTLLAHCVKISDSDINLLAQTNTNVAHCPAAAAKLACGVARTPLMQKQGINISLGSDGPTCNNSLDLFQEMKFGSLIQKATHCDPTIFDADTMIRMATINGATSLGKQDEIGSIEVGKSADLIFIDLMTPNMQPIFWDEGGSNLVSNIVYSAQGSNVQHVMINGKWVLKDRSPVHLNTIQLYSEVKSQANDWMQRRKYHEQFISQPIA